MKRFLNYSYYGILLLFLLILAQNNVFAQLKGTKIGFGLSTVQILGNNVATQPFLTSSEKGDVFGGSFDGSQPGLRLEMSVPLDKNGNFDMPIGIDYHFYMGRERQPVSSTADIKFRSDIDVATFTLGLNWAFYRFDPEITDAKFYFGLEARAASIMEGIYERDANYNLVNDVTYKDPTKPATFRFGGALNFGVNGEIYDPWFVNINFGLGLMNLIGRDDQRGELMSLIKKTPTYNELKENYLFNYHFSLLIQYKL